MTKDKVIKLYVWLISGTVVSKSVAIGVGATKEEAIEYVCGDANEDIRDELGQELQNLEPFIATVQPNGRFCVSST